LCQRSASGSERAQGVGWRGDRLAVQFVVMPPVLELFLDTAGHLEAQIGRDGDVARIEQAMNVAPKQEPIARVMFAAVAIASGPDELSGIWQSTREITRISLRRAGLRLLMQGVCAVSLVDCFQRVAFARTGYRVAYAKSSVFQKLVKAEIKVRPAQMGHLARQPPLHLFQLHLVEKPNGVLKKENRKSEWACAIKIPAFSLELLPLCPTEPAAFVVGETAVTVRAEGRAPSEQISSVNVAYQRPLSFQSRQHVGRIAPVRD
jgi:hypothetical protein